MKKWKIYVITATVIAFIGSNLFLLLKDDSKAERTVYINDWTRIEQGDVTKTFDAEGVALPESEHYIYLDANQENVSSFYVKEGDVLAVGTPLFSYDAKELEEKKAELEVEITRLQGELSSIELQIAELNRLEFVRPSQSNNTESTDVTVNVDMTAIAEGNVAQSIAAAEAERGKIESSITANEKRLARISEQISNLTVSSTFEGQVIQINKDLSAPLITVASSTLAVEGVLSEQQMKDAAVGQKVKLYSELLDQKYSGVITQVKTYPNDEPGIGKEPTYSFTVTLDEETPDESLEAQGTEENLSGEMVIDELGEQVGGTADGELLIGAKLEMTIIAEEALNVPVISTNSLMTSGKNKYAYLLTSDGTIRKQETLIGLSFGGKSEIISGLNADQVVVTHPNIVPTDKAFFITPMQTSHLQKDALSQLPKKQYVKYILMGLIEN